MLRGCTSVNPTHGLPSKNAGSCQLETLTYSTDGAFVEVRRSKVRVIMLQWFLLRPSSVTVTHWSISVQRLSHVIINYSAIITRSIKLYSRDPRSTVTTSSCRPNYADYCYSALPHPARMSFKRALCTVITWCRLHRTYQSTNKSGDVLSHARTHAVSSLCCQWVSVVFCSLTSRERHMLLLSSCV